MFSGTKKNISVVVPRHFFFFAWPNNFFIAVRKKFLIKEKQYIFVRKKSGSNKKILAGKKKLAAREKIVLSLSISPFFSLASDIISVGVLLSSVAFQSDSEAR